MGEQQGLGGTTESPGWVSESVDWHKPSPARIYDVHLGGSHNFAVDREVAAKVVSIMPDVPRVLRANRSFLGRAVRYLVSAGIRQFLDLGSGIPTVGNVHEVAQQIDPTCRVVYVDIDPVAVAHSRTILAGNPHAMAMGGDLRCPERILAAPVLRDLLDLSQPIAVLMVAVLHFIPDADDPAGIVARYVDVLAPGSYVALSHATAGKRAPEQVRAAVEAYTRRVDGFYLRDQPQVAALLGDLELVEPGITSMVEWHPDPGAEDADVDPARLPGFAAVARKP